MIVTEEEARETYCWRTIAASTTYNEDRQDFEWPEPQCCKGSLCMAWRVAYRSEKDPNAIVAHFRPSSESHWIEVGYCGLAGKVTP